MTYAPTDLLTVRRYLLAHLDLHPGAVAADLEPDEVGIVGDDQHPDGYHVGNSALAAVGKLTSDYSKRESSRDRPGTNGASALDVGDFRYTRADGTVVTLRSLSLALVAACKAGDPRCRDIREVIYSPDGSTVRRWDRLGIRSSGDSSHLFHTHISFFRDSEGRRAQPDNVLGLLAAIIEGDDVLTPEQAMLLQSDAWRVHTVINDEELVPVGAPYVGGQPNKLRLRLVGLEGKVDQLIVAAAADATRDQAAKAAIDAMATALINAGGSVDSAAIIARMDAIAAAESATVTALRTEIAALRQRIAAAAQAEATALQQP